MTEEKSMAETRVLLYAEMLPNLRQISVMASLEMPSNASTTGELSWNGRQFIFIHQGQTFTLSLPGQAIVTAQLQRPFIDSKELSWRLPIVNTGHSPVESAQENLYPWAAKDLSSESEFVCRGCTTTIVLKGAMKSWRDLPSENWAEMMDFWHCHKPDVDADNKNSHNGHNHSEDPNANKAYGANTKFNAQPGIGFVDLTSFLLVDSDCENIQTIASEEALPKLQAVTCISCNTPLGNVDSQSSGIRLYKWRLSLSRSSGRSSLASPLISTVIAAKLISILRAQCTSKIIVIPETPSSSGILHLWILQQSLFYSSSGFDKKSRTFAMKVLWQRISDKESEKLIDKGQAEDVTLPSDAVAAVENCLKESKSYLPPGARILKGWDVGLLERYWEE